MVFGRIVENACQLFQGDKWSTKHQKASLKGEREKLLRGIMKENPIDPEIEKDKSVKGGSNPFNDFFENATPEYQCSIDRVRPLWCAGWVDTIPIEIGPDGSPVINLEEIRENYGGERLQLRFHDARGRYVAAKTINFRGVAPRVDGVELETPQQKAEREETEKQKRMEAGKAEKSADNLTKYLLEQSQIAARENIELLKAHLFQKSDPMSGIKDMLSMFEMLEKFKGVGAGGSGSDLNSMLSGLAELMKHLPKNDSSSFGEVPHIGPVKAGASSSGSIRIAPTMPGPVASPSGPVASPSGPVASPSGPVASPSGPVASPQNSGFDGADISEYDQSIAEELAVMTDDEIAGVLLETLSMIGDDRAIKVFEKFKDTSTPAADPGSACVSPSESKK